MSLVGKVHAAGVGRRRARVLAAHVAALLPRGASVLDVGCGDGEVARRVMELRPDLRIEGVEVVVRPGAAIPVTPFDGRRLPFPDRSFDAAMLVDVLHHTEDPAALLAEAARVARAAVVLKDHTRDGVLAGPTLRLMDWVGNRHPGIPLPYNYWPRARWDEAFRALGLSVERWVGALGLYPAPASWLFDRGLHFAARLAPRAPSPSLPS